MCSLKSKHIFMVFCEFHMVVSSHYDSESSMEKSGKNLLIRGKMLKGKLSKQLTLFSLNWINLYIYLFYRILWFFCCKVNSWNILEIRQLKATSFSFISEMNLLLRLLFLQLHLIKLPIRNITPIYLFNKSCQK